MQTYSAHVSEIKLNFDNQLTARIECHKKAIPSPGRYLMAWDKSDMDAVLGIPLFASEVSDHSFLTSPPVPPNWQPGTELLMRGPLGHGYNLPTDRKRIGLAAFECTIARLIPIINVYLPLKSDIALFTDCAIPTLPSAIEVHALSKLQSALLWPDMLYIDIGHKNINSLRQKLNIEGNIETILGASQILVSSPMPCGGLADCGICTLKGARSNLLICKNGPVFDFNKII